MTDLIEKAMKRFPTRVYRARGGIVIDVWCDGDEQEAKRVADGTRKIRELTDGGKQ